MGQMRPYLNLMNVLSDFIIQLVDTNLNKITFSYTGNIAQHDCTPITVCGLAVASEPPGRAGRQHGERAARGADRMGIVVDEVKSQPVRGLLQHDHHHHRRPGREAPGLRHPVRGGAAHRQAARLPDGLPARGAHAAAGLRRPPGHHRQDRHHPGRGTRSTSPP